MPVRSNIPMCMCGHGKRDHNEATEAHECTHRYCACQSYTEVGEAGFDPAEEACRPFKHSNVSFDSILDTANRQWNQIQVWLKRQESWHQKERELNGAYRQAKKTREAMEVEMLALRCQIDRHQEMFKLLADAGRLPSFMMDVLAPEPEDYENDGC